MKIFNQQLIPINGYRKVANNVEDYGYRKAKESAGEPDPIKNHLPALYEELKGWMKDDFKKQEEKKLPFVEKVKELRESLYQAVTSLIPETILNGHPEGRLPNTLNLTLPGMRGESIVIALDHYGVALSSGSACKSGSPEPTHVLIAMGRTEEEAHCSVRFSLSRYNTEEDITQTVTALSQVLKDKEIVRLAPCK